MSRPCWSQEVNNGERHTLLTKLRAALKPYLDEWLSVVKEMQRPYDRKATCADKEPRCLEWAAAVSFPLSDISQAPAD